MKNTAKMAFTLAETLIVMGIIGVVAALTIPSLTNSTNSKDIVAKVRKAHTNLEDAYGRMIGTYGEIDEWGETLDSNIMGKRLMSTMKLTKNCAYNGTDCFANDTNFYASNDAAKKDNAQSNTSVYKVVKADGVSLGVYIDNANCTGNVSNNTAPQDLKEICGIALVDVDGPNKGKNKHGQDLFQFYITKKGIYPVGTDVDSKFKYIDNCTKTGATTTSDSQACTAWVVYNGNLDYKKADSSGKCLTDNTKTLDFTKNTHCD